MKGRRSKFKDLDERITGQVKFGDCCTVEIEGKGIVALRCKNRELLLREFSTNEAHVKNWNGTRNANHRAAKRSV